MPGDSQPDLVALVGPAGCGKTAWLVERYASALRTARTAGVVPRLLWLAPHRLAGEDVRRRLVRLGIDASLEPGIRTFSRFADSLVSLDPDGPTVVPSSASRWLLEQSLAELNATGQLKVMAGVARRIGLANAIEQMVGELKSRGLSADRFARWAKHPHREMRDRDLALVYSHYQAACDAAGLADHFDLHRLGAESLARAPKQTRWDLVVVDGFESFAYYERQMLMELARRSKALIVSLAAEDPSARYELTSAARRTLDWLKYDWPTLRVEKLAPQPTSVTPSLVHLREQLFVPPDGEGNPASVPHAGIEVLPATDLFDEAVLVARRVKSLLVAGTPAEDIVITAASVEPHRRRLAEVFKTYGVPAAFTSPTLVGDDPALRALASVLSLELDDWPFRQVVATLANLKLTKFDAPTTLSHWRTVRGAAEWLVRDLQLASGRVALLRDVARLAESYEEGQKPSSRVAAAKDAAPALTLLAEATEALPSSASPTAWVSACERLALALGLPLDSRQTGAWKQVRESAAWLERVAASVGEGKVRWTRAEWIDRLSQWMDSVPASTMLREEGHVRVLSASAARYVSVPHLFVIGLDESSFSSAGSSSGLYSEQVLETMAAADVWGEAATATPPYERTMQLFYDVVRSASETLVLSYPALDTAGQQAPPSPMLTEACRPFGPELLGTLTRTPEITSLPPEGSPPRSLRDWRLLGVHRAVRSNPATLGSLLKSPVAAPSNDSLAATLVTMHHRARGDSFGPMEGVFGSQDARRWFADRYGADHQWSTSQLETYATCPYKFLLKNVLRIEPLGDARLEVDYSRRGSLLHRVFAELHSRLTDFTVGKQPSDCEAEVFTAELNDAVEAARTQLASYGLHGVLDELLADEVAKWATKYHDQHRKYDEVSRDFDEPLKPTHFELRFGKASRESDDDESPASRDAPYQMDLGGELTIQVGGRIDRVDVGQVAGRTVFQVIDYKSASDFTLTDEEAKDGRKLQPPLYALAAAELLGVDGELAVPLRVGYWVLRKAGFSDRTTRELYRVEAGQVAETIDWKEYQPVLQEQVKRIVEGVRHAEFPMVSPDEECTSHCDFSHVCRVHQVRSLKKEWPAPKPEEACDLATAEPATKKKRSTKGP